MRVKSAFRLGKLPPVEVMYDMICFKAVNSNHPLTYMSWCHTEGNQSLLPSIFSWNCATNIWSEVLFCFNFWGSEMVSELLDRLTTLSVSFVKSWGATARTLIVMVVVVWVRALMLLTSVILTKFRSLRFCWRFLTLVVSWARSSRRQKKMLFALMSALYRVCRETLDSVNMILASADIRMPVFQSVSFC